MKKIVLLIGILVLSQTATAQEHQFSAGVGLASTNQFIDIISTSLSAIFSGGELENAQNMGELRIAYAYTPNKRLSFGAAISYNSSEYDIVKDNAVIGSQTSNFYTFAGEATYYYLKGEKVRLYGILGAGVTFMDYKQQDENGSTAENNSQTYFNFQVTPIGVSYGRQFGGFAELGFGYRGILSFGLYYIL